MKRKTKKLNFEEMGKTLSRQDMKEIMAGYGSCGGSCLNDSFCTGICFCVASDPAINPWGNCVSEWPY